MAIKTKAIYHFLLKFFQICGMCPISLNFCNTTMQSLSVVSDKKILHVANKKINLFLLPIELLWSILCLSLFMPFIWFLLTHKTVIMQGDDPINRSLSTLNATMILFAHFLIILEAVWRKKNLQKIWQNFQYIHQHSHHPNETKFHNNYLIKFFCSYCFTWIIEILSTCLSQGYGYITYWSVCIFSLMMLRVRYLYEIMFIDMLTQSFMEINVKLQKLATNYSYKCQGNEHFDKKLDGKLAELIKIYSKLYEITNDLIEFGNFSKLINITLCFVQLVSYSFWAYDEFQCGNYKIAESMLFF